MHINANLLPSDFLLFHGYPITRRTSPLSLPEYLIRKMEGRYSQKYKKRPAICVNYTYTRVATPDVRTQTLVRYSKGKKIRRRYIGNAGFAFMTAFIPRRYLYRFGYFYYQKSKPLRIRFAADLNKVRFTAFRSVFGPCADRYSLRVSGFH